MTKKALILCRVVQLFTRSGSLIFVEAQRLPEAEREMVDHLLLEAVCRLNPSANAVQQLAPRCFRFALQNGNKTTRPIDNVGVNDRYPAACCSWACPRAILSLAGTHLNKSLFPSLATAFFSFLTGSAPGLSGGSGGIGFWSGTGGRTDRLGMKPKDALSERESQAIASEKLSAVAAINDAQIWTLQQYRGYAQLSDTAGF
jgi:hypothetical protein